RKLNSARMFLSSIGPALTTGRFRVCAEVGHGLEASRNERTRATSERRRVIRSPAMNRIRKLLGVVAGTRARYQIGTIADGDLDAAPTPVARRVRGFVAQTVNLAEIVDDLFVNAVQVRKFTRLVVRAATLFSEYPHGAARVPE